ncbi:hypothetical protein AB0F91_21575 [Amycolatopsis sp. NPDC023774]
MNTGQRNQVMHYAGRVDLHQFTSNGCAAGTVGSVDLSYTGSLSGSY